MKKILVVSDTYLFPARNGMELPISKSIQILKNKYSFDLLIINYDEKLVDEKKRLKKNKLFDKILLGKRKDVSFLKKIIDEIFLIRPFFSNIKLNLKNISFNSYDYIWISNTSLIGFTYLIKGYLNRTLVTINDSNYYTYYERIKTSFNGREKISFNKLTYILRLPFLILNEIKYLKSVYKIHVQTQLEKQRTQRIGIPKSKIIVISNGINESLTSVKYNPNSKNILLMSHMTEGREFQTFWFLNKIWPKVNKKLKNLVLIVIGAQPKNIKEIKEKYKNVVFKDYVKDLSNEYSNAVMSIIPHYQSTGYINRLSDTICAGVPTIISEKIAKTEPDFKNNIHGFVFKTKKELINKIYSLHKNQKKRYLFSNNLKKLASEKNNWNDFSENINKIFKY